MNILDGFTIEKIRQMVRAGMSQRQIAGRAGVSRNAAHKYMNQFRDEAPRCRHDSNLYDCATCCSSRRFSSVDRDIIWIKPGPKTKAPPPEPSPREPMDEYGVLRTALVDVLRDSKWEK